MSSTLDHESADVPALELTAYQLWEPALEIVAAPLRRDWMTKTREHFAYRCLPMCIANEYGWMVLSDQTVDILWDGSSSAKGLAISAGSEASKNTPISHFGEGVVTWKIPYLFRTPPGYDLLVRGPTNYYKDGISPLDGIVETDWAGVPFTINWKVTRRGHPIRFEKNEPIGMILPLRHAELETITPCLRHLSEDSELQKAYQKWNENRTEVLSSLRPNQPSSERPWGRDYWRGISLAPIFPGEHKIHMRLQEFRRVSDVSPGPENTITANGESPVDKIGS